MRMRKNAKKRESQGNFVVCLGMLSIRHLLSFIVGLNALGGQKVFSFTLLCCLAFLYPNSRVDSDTSLYMFRTEWLCTLVGLVCCLFLVLLLLSFLVLSVSYISYSCPDEIVWFC